jgi:hypothetical protein
MKKYLPVLMLLGASMTVAIPQASAETAAPQKKVEKKAPKKAAAKPAEKNQQPNLAGKTGTDFNCELGSKVTIYENADDSNRISLQWNKKVHELTRVATTTGANRFENKSAGLVWINIPAKGMLLDSKQGRQLANGCKSKHQI